MENGGRFASKTKTSKIQCFRLVAATKDAANSSLPTNVSFNNIELPSC